MTVHVQPAELVIDSQDHEVVMRSCELYRGHPAAVLEYHHICPKSWWVAAGKPVATPMIFLCGTCHDNVHAAIDAMIKGYGVQHMPRYAVRLARRAFTIAEANALTPKPTL
jgi:hypothetical protein